MEAVSGDSFIPKKPLIEITRSLRPSTVVELGSYNGRDSVFIADLCNNLICVEGRLENCESMKRLFSTRSQKASPLVVNMDIRKFLKRKIQTNLIWASGILYHLDDPVSVIRDLCAICIDNKCPVIGWTHLSESSEVSIGGYNGRWWTEDPENSPLSSISNKTSFWMTPDSFEKSFIDGGLGGFSFLDTPKASPTGGLTAYFIASP